MTCGASSAQSLHLVLIVNIDPLTEVAVESWTEVLFTRPRCNLRFAPSRRGLQVEMLDVSQVLDVAVHQQEARRNQEQHVRSTLGK